MDIDTPAQLFSIQSTELAGRTHTVSYIRDLSMDEYTAYKEACQKLVEFDAWQTLIHVAIENYRELRNALSEAKSFRLVQSPKSELRDLL